jgi:hypothetical protein
VTSTALAPQVRFDGQEFAVGDHLHYQADGTLAIQATNDEYIESCRFKRIDGILRVFQDWQLYDLTTMDRDALASVAADGGIQDTYSDYVQDYVLNQAGVSTITPTKPDAVTNITTTVGASRQLEARGIYIDKIYDLDGNENPTAYSEYITQDSPTNVDRIEKIPFSEVNLSLLAHWSTADGTKVTVTNEDVATIADPASDYYGTYSRGYISALLETSASGVPITATIPDNNNGITQLVDATNIDVDDPVTIIVGASAGSINITGTYAITFPLGNTSSPTISITGGGACTLPGSPGNTFECTVTSPWSGTIQINVAVTSGNPSKRCTGSSGLYTGTNISTDQTHTFTSFACTAS